MIFGCLDIYKSLKNGDVPRNGSFSVGVQSIKKVQTVPEQRPVKAFILV
jgi:hypothetical protein